MSTLIIQTLPNPAMIDDVLYLDENDLHEHSLEEIKHFYHQILKGLPGAFYICDADGHILFYNESAEELWGRKPVIGEDLWCGSWKIYQPDGTSLPLDSCPMAVTLKEQRPVNGAEILVERPDGDLRTVRPHPRPIFNSEGLIIGAYNMLVDVTEEKKSQRKVQESEQFLQKMIASSTDCIKVLDLQGRLLSMNEGGQQSLEIDDISYLLNTFYVDFLSEDIRPKVLEAVKKAAMGETARFTGFKYTLKTNTPKWWDVMITPIPGLDGKPERLLAVSRDITPHTMLQEELRKRNEELIKINEDLDNFIHMASHDLKMPIVNIEGLIQFLKEIQHSTEPTAANDAAVTLRLIEQSIGRFKNTLLDLAEVGKVQKSGEEEKNKINGKEIIEDVLLSIDDKIRSSNAHITVDTSAHNEFLFSKKNFKSIVYNLLSNAVKYKHSERRPEIYIQLRAEGAYTVLTVRDNGLGIQAHNMNKLFAMFKRFHDHVEGSGIGLYIVKKIIDNAGGKIEVQSEENAGTTFTVYLKE